MPMDPGTCDPAALARLARLDLDEEERSLFEGQLRRMIKSFNRISGLHTDGVEPFTRPGDPLMSIREDQPSPGHGGGNHLAVPRPSGRGPGGKR